VLVANGRGLPTAALLTDMNEPLGLRGGQRGRGRLRRRLPHRPPTRAAVPRGHGGALGRDAGAGRLADRARPGRAASRTRSLGRAARSSRMVRRWRPRGPPRRNRAARPPPSSGGRTRGRARAAVANREIGLPWWRSAAGDDRRRTVRPRGRLHRPRGIGQRGRASQAARHRPGPHRAAARPARPRCGAPTGGDAPAPAGPLILERVDA
jgi:hypothetical protein